MLIKERFLVTGASGFIGQKLCNELVSRGYFVKAALRDNSAFQALGCEVVRVPDISSDYDWTNVLQGVTTVIHLAARVHIMHESLTDPIKEFRRVNVASTERLARLAAAKGVKRLVFVSSVKVNGEKTIDGRMFTEMDVPFPQDPYGVSKYEAERMLYQVSAETGLEIVIVRPPLVYGPGVKGNFEQLIKVLTIGTPLPLACIKNQRSLIYVGNLIDALILCATHPKAAGQTYLVKDIEDVSTQQLVKNTCKAFGRSSRLFPCPIFLLSFLGKLLGKLDAVNRLTESLMIDSSKIHKELGWQVPYSMMQGLEITAAWFKQSRKLL